MASSPPENLPFDWKRATEELLRGREFAYLLKKAVVSSNSDANDNQDAVEDNIDEGRVSVDDLVVKILKSFTNTLSIVNNSVDPDELSQFRGTTHVDSLPRDTSRKSEDSGESGHSIYTIKDRRVQYKRRKTSHSWTTDTPDWADDGHEWRKYGQKSILNAKFSRSYFRCTHKHDQGCQATKQVQQIKANPPMYRTTYYGNHTCKQQPKACHHLFLEESTAEAHDSSIIISFKDNSNFSSMQEYGPFFQSLSSTKQEHKDEQLQQNDDDDHNNTKINATHEIDSINYDSSCLDYLLPDLHDHLSTVFDHGDVIPAVNSSSSSHSLDMDMITSSIGHACFANDDDDMLFPYGF